MVETLDNGYSISKEGEESAMELIYNKENDTWNVVTSEVSKELVKINNDGTADLYLPNGATSTITLDAQGMMAAHQLLESGLFYAAR